jgi:hypothetical protein
MPALQRRNSVARVSPGDPLMLLLGFGDFEIDVQVA